MSKTVYLSLGSNLGDREKNLLKANEMISAMEGFEVIGHSPIYVNPAVEMDKDSPGFFNMIIKGEFAYRPNELLTNVEDIEIKLGRTNKGECKPRTIDIDIILFGDEVIETDKLSIPHRKMTMRAFVLKPMLQIDPEIIHPVTKEKLKIYCELCNCDELVLYKEPLEVHV
ncbi:MAG: 2-amino-4-hydroxy-6-hydroxymethyldihydropteridine diphosphokinase [candidate division Zixibacteria bacterium]|nr:2-amino-4-hydroxy-6-hydroxymethyldihydropteridine diphosphokinase [candidate division Zixibacteria bacterium]